MTPWIALAAVAALLAACTATSNPGEMPAAAGAPAPAAQAAPPGPAGANAAPAALPMERHEASAQCWMKYDRTGASLDAKSKLVDKCISDKMSGKQ
jgi:hypothetical protein